MRVGYAMALALTLGNGSATATVDLSLEPQVQRLTDADCVRVYTDTVTQTGQARSGLLEALADVGDGDTLVVTSLDRLDGSPNRVFERIAALQEKGVGLVSLDDDLEISYDDGRLVCSNFAALAALPRMLGRRERTEPTAHRPHGHHTHSDVAPSMAPPPARTWHRRALYVLAALVGVGLLYLLCFAVVPHYDQYTGRVIATRMLSTSPVGPAAACGTGNTTEAVTIQVTSGNLTGHSYTLNESYPTTGYTRPAYQIGDSVLLGFEPSSKTVFLDTFDRRAATFALLLVFLALVALVARRQGLMSLLGMSFSVVVILAFVAPNILAGGNPLWYAACAAVVIIPVTYYLAHGLSTKTTVAILATFVTLLVTMLIAALFAQLLHVPFVLSEDQSTLNFATTGQLIDPATLYLAALLIGALAVLNDITISQASVVASLHRSNPSLGVRGLVAHAMAVGNDHVASLVNTLLLVYVGVSFAPLLNDVRTMAIGAFSVSNPDFSADLLRVIVVSIGIVLAVPISTYVAAYLTLRQRSGPVGGMTAKPGALDRVAARVRQKARRGTPISAHTSRSER